MANLSFPKGVYLTEDVIHPESGTVMYLRGTKMTRTVQQAVEDAGIVFSEAVVFHDEGHVSDYFANTKVWYIPDFAEQHWGESIRTIRQLIQSNGVSFFSLKLNDWVSVQSALCPIHGPYIQVDVADPYDLGLAASSCSYYFYSPQQAQQLAAGDAENPYSMGPFDPPVVQKFVDWLAVQLTTAEIISTRQTMEKAGNPFAPKDLDKVVLDDTSFGDIELEDDDDYISLYEAPDDDALDFDYDDD